MLLEIVCIHQCGETAVFFGAAVISELWKCARASKKIKLFFTSVTWLVFAKHSGHIFRFFRVRGLSSVILAEEYIIRLTDVGSIDDSGGIADGASSCTCVRRFLTLCPV